MKPAVSIVAALAITVLINASPRAQKTKAAQTDDAPQTQGRAPMAELWTEPPPGRNLFYGVGGRALAPDPDDVYTVIEIKGSGFSNGYTVTDGHDRKWSAKFAPESRTEVVSSRLLWALGYHQPPTYHLESWRAVGADEPNPQRDARFREKKPKFHGLDDHGGWSYAHNPFVGTVQLNGLLVLQAMLGNSDLKDDNNAFYTLDEPVDGARRWYVARDLGQTWGRSGAVGATRGDIDAFEKTRFVLGTTGDAVELDYHGLHGDLFEHIRIRDVVWICRRLARLTDAQLADMFRAGGYEPDLAARFIRVLKQKIGEGLALAPKEPAS